MDAQRRLSVRDVLVTGGTGFIGSNLTIALLDEGCHVRIRRPNSDPRAIEDAPMQYCIGDIRDPDSLRGAMKGCETVLHTAAKVSCWRREREEMYNINIDGTRYVVDARLELNVEKLVHTSSIAAIGYSEDGALARETNEFNWDRYDVGYRISKHLAEREVQRGVRRGLHGVLVNPSVVIGPRSERQYNEPSLGTEKQDFSRAY